LRGERNNLGFVAFVSPVSEHGGEVVDGQLSRFCFGQNRLFTVF
jgi:hypothetical protein